MKEQIHGGDIYRHRGVIDFSSNCNPFGVPEGVVKAIADAAADASHYPDIQCSELRKALSEKLDIDEEMFYFGNGAAEIIFTVAMGLKPKKALITAPAFAEYENALKAASCKVERYYSSEDRGFAFDGKIAEKLTEDTDILFVCNPNNPTGTLMSTEDMMKIIDRARETGTVTVVDECFMDFVSEENKSGILGLLKKEPERFRHVIVLKAFTKLYAMAGVRLGYAICTDENMISRLESPVQPWNISSLAQAAGVQALKEDAYVENSLRVLEDEKKRLLSFFEEEAVREKGIRTYGSLANYIFFRGPAGLYERMLEKGILIRDCSNYPGLDSGDPDYGYYRIAVRLEEDNRKFMNTLKQI